MHRSLPTTGILATVLAALTFAASGSAREAFPTVVPLPDGFQPEGIATGYGPELFAGSLANGAIYRADLRTGAGALLVAGEAGRVAVGLSFDRRSGNLFVAGGPTGTGRVIDTRTGEEIASYRFFAGTGFVNDVIVTREAAYFTNSAAAVLYRVALGPAGAPAGGFETITLGGDWQQVAGFNANGIEASASGDALIVVNSTVGALYRVDPASGVATEIELGGATVKMGDGLLLQGTQLHVVRNQANEVVVIDLARDLASGALVKTITDPRFEVPTTIARFGGALYLVNARFGLPPGSYEIVRVEDR